MFSAICADAAWTAGAGDDARPARPRRVLHVPVQRARSAARRRVRFAMKIAWLRMARYLMVSWCTGEEPVMSNAFIRTSSYSPRSGRRRRRMRALLAMTAIWTLLFAWALSSALSAIDAPPSNLRASLLPVSGADISAVDVSAADTRVAATEIDDGAPAGVQVSVDTEGALTDGQQASDAALYVAER
jgi:hypothetical protein